MTPEVTPVTNESAPVNSEEVVQVNPEVVSDEVIPETSEAQIADLDNVSDEFKAQLEELQQVKAEYAQLIADLAPILNLIIIDKMRELAKRFNGYKYITVHTEKRYIDDDSGKPNSDLSELYAIFIAHKVWPVYQCVFPINATKVDQININSVDNETECTEDQNISGDFTSKGMYVIEAMPVLPGSDQFHILDRKSGELVTKEPTVH